MKTHYARAFSYDSRNGKGLCGKKNPGSKLDPRVFNDHRNTTCLLCIAAMSPGEQMWHDRNNEGWIGHKAKDGRRNPLVAPAKDDGAMHRRYDESLSEFRDRVKRAIEAI